MSIRSTFAALGAMVLAGCGGSTAKDTKALDATAVPKSLTVTSPAFTNGNPIPRANSCDGTGTPPTIPTMS